MKHEKLIRGIGEVDDRILERYNQIDTRLARKHAKKAIALRVLAVAACLVLLIGVCVPVGFMVAHPIGRAVLKGDSAALTKELEKIEGFYDWQEKTAEKLKETLPEGMFEFMQNTPVLNVLTTSPFSGLSPMDSFEENKPYHLYFISNGDGTCTLKYITTDPTFVGDFVLEIPETSPAGDTVTAIDIDPINRRVTVKEGLPKHFPCVLTPATLQSLIETAKANGISAYDLGVLQAYYLKLSVNGLDAHAVQEMISTFPIVAVGDVCIFDTNTSAAEIELIYRYLIEYCEWNEEKYEQSIDEIVQMAKRSGSREAAELCMTVLRDMDLGRITGITIPETVRSINQKLWTCLPALETVTIDADHPAFQMIDGCLVDTETGTLMLYLREDGKFPADADIRVLDSYAFSLYTLQKNADEEAELHIPESVTEIRYAALEDLSAEDSVFTIHIYLPAGLKFFGGMASENDYYRAIYHYPGTMAEWERDVTLGTVDWDCSILLLTSDIDEPTVYYFPRRFS